MERHKAQLQRYLISHKEEAGKSKSPEAKSQERQQRGTGAGGSSHRRSTVSQRSEDDDDRVTRKTLSTADDLSQSHGNESRRREASQSEDSASQHGEMSQSGQRALARAEMSQREDSASVNGEMSQRGKSASARGEVSQRGKSASERGGISQSGQRALARAEMSQREESSSERGKMSQRGKSASARGEISQSGKSASSRSEVSQRGKSASSRSEVSQRGNSVSARSEVSQRGKSASARGEVSHRGKNASIRKGRMKILPPRPVYTKIDGKLHINSFPDELLFKVFSLLNPQDLLSSAQVCRRWKAVGSDNVLWERTYHRYAAKVIRGQKAIKIPPNPQASFWKSISVRRGAEFRNGKALPLLKKIHPFTGLPKASQDALQKAGTRWVASFVDEDGRESSAFHSDVFYFSMSVCVRWYSLVLPNIHRMRKLRLYAANPVFYDSNGRAIVNSPCQRSLLYETEFRLNQMTSSLSPVGSDDVINTYNLPSGVIVATWKDGGDLAFISKVFHSHQLVKRCLMGTNISPYLPPAHKPFRDDVDPKYGLHSYTCTLELHNQRTSFWSQQYLNLHCLPDVQDGYAVMQLISPDSSYDRSPIAKKITFPWKTDALKGIIQGACILDVTLLDDRSNPMWCSCSHVKVKAPEETDVVNYEYEGDLYRIDHEDAIGKVQFGMIWESRDEQYFITSLQLHLSLAWINGWFATNH